MKFIVRIVGLSVPTQLVDDREQPTTLFCQVRRLFSGVHLHLLIGRVDELQIVPTSFRYCAAPGPLPLREGMY